MALAGVLVSGTLLLAANSVGQMAFQIRVRNDLTILTTTLQSVLWTGAVIAVAARGGSIATFAAWLLVTSAVASTAQILLGRRMVPIVLRGARALWPALIKVGVPLGIAGALVQAAERVDQLLVFLLAGSTEAGYYAAAYRVMDAAHFIPVAVTTTAFPVIASVYRTDRERVQRVTQTAFDYLMALTLPAFAVTFVAGGPIIRLLFGSQFSAAASALPVLMAALVANVVGYLANMGVLLSRLERAFVLYAGVGLVFNVAANCVLIPLYGFVAAAWVTLATELLVSGLTARLVLARTGLRLQFGRVARAAVAAAVTALATYVLDHAGLAIGWLLCAAGAIYAVLILALRAIDPGDIRVVLARR
jgi:O-antigen/teichoic acid export membrane protein